MVRSRWLNGETWYRTGVLPTIQFSTRAQTENPTFWNAHSIVISSCIVRLCGNAITSYSMWAYADLFTRKIVQLIHFACKVSLVHYWRRSTKSWQGSAKLDHVDRSRVHFTSIWSRWRYRIRMNHDVYRSECSPTHDTVRYECIASKCGFITRMHTQYRSVIEGNAYIIRRKFATIQHRNWIFHIQLVGKLNALMLETFC